MGSAALGQCFATALEAAAFTCGTSYPSVSTGVDTDGTIVAASVQCTAYTASTLQLRRQKNGGVAAVVQQPTSFVSCDQTEWLNYHPFQLNASDGALVSGAVIGCWLLAYAWRASRQVVDES